jgi:hypothetical protein
MKTLARRMTIAAAALMASTSLVWGASAKADVPFAFRTAHTMMAPGTYRVSLLYRGGGAVVKFENLSAKTAAVEMSNAPVAPARAMMDNSNPKLLFECGPGRCYLREVWTGSGPAYRFARPQLGRDEQVRVLIIPLLKTTNAA